MVAEYVPDAGDLIKVDFRAGHVGHEQAGWRPALVLSPRGYNRKTGLADSQRTSLNRRAIGFTRGDLYTHCGSPQGTTCYVSGLPYTIYLYLQIKNGATGTSVIGKYARLQVVHNGYLYTVG